ncbi:MAG: hypothetical protein COB81_09120 [Flavobacteriaceae bacterium]|nr:MAG: hypothetical protein COB81_09120 [Flavobacteriaceae bacterium]
MKNKYVLLFLSLLFDAIGMLSFTVPVLGESFDIIWAPIAAFLIFKMYKGTEGKIAGAVTFIEEAMPGLDIIPTFTLTWIYKFLLKKSKK